MTTTLTALPSREATRRLVRSTLARRLIVGLCLGALVPFALFGLMAYRQVETQILDEVDRQLHYETKAVAMRIVERLLYIETTLELLGQVERDAPSRSLTTMPRWRTLAEAQFSSMTLIEADGRVVDVLGPPLRPGVLSEAAEQHLSAGGLAVLSRPGDREAFGVAEVLFVRPAIGGGRLWARVRPEYLWDSGTEGALPDKTAIAVVSGRSTLARTAQIPADALLHLASPIGSNSAGRLRWAHDETDYLVSFWSIPMEANYSTAPWVVVLARERDQILAPLEQFRVTFPLLIALTLFTILLVSIRQVRLGLDPLSQLRDAMDRISGTDFSPRVDLATGDEIEALATRFNAMAAQLGEHFESRVALAHELDAQRSRLQNLVEQLPHGLVLLDASRRIVLANRLGRDQLDSLAGVGQGERLEHLADLTLDSLPPSSGPVVWRELRIDTTPPRCFAFTHRTIQTGDELPGSALVLRDITADKAQEDQFRRQERLASVGQLAAGMAHDLNNTLQVILSATQLLQAAEPEMAGRREVEMILDQSRHGASLIRQMLDFSRQSPHDAAVLDLRTVFSDTLDLLRRMLPVTIELVAELPEQSIPIRGDSTQLQQVITNLVINARDAMATSGGRLTIELARIDAMAIIRFEDTGEGMSPEVQAKIFDPFFTTKAPGHGTGLGLAQVYGIIDAHGGHIRVDSTVGRGTCFEISIPTTERQASGPAAVDTDAPSGSAQRILVVEDQEVVQEIVRSALESLGYAVATAENGLDALAQLESAPLPDAILSDVIMPEMGGRDLAETVCRRWPEIPIILMSGYSDEHASSLAAIECVREVLPKPVALDLLARTIDVVLRERD